MISRLGRLSLTNTLDMLEQTGRALQAAHSQGLVHRDVKPGNILITPVGQVKITDFGIAKAVDSAPVTKTGMVMGTAQYISPEQATGDEATAASDVYSLGVVGYEALTGRRPFLGDGAITVAMKHIREAPPPLPTNLPSGVRELVEITMAKDPRQRYANGGEFADAVAAVRAGRRPPRPGAIAGAAAGAAGAAALGAAVARGATPTGAASRPVTPRPTSQTAVAPPPPDNSWTTGQKVLAGIAAALLVGAIGLIGFYLVNSGNGDAATPPPPSTTVVETTTAVEPTEEPDEPTTTRRTTRTTTSEETSSEETTTETTTPRQQTDTSEPPPDPGAATGTPCFPGVPFSPLC